ncbi:MAG: hypothetical protein MHM6MM_000352 [Cercozoa sp. M6MM]
MTSSLHTSFAPCELGESPRSLATLGADRRLRFFTADARSEQLCDMAEKGNLSQQYTCVAVAGVSGSETGKKRSRDTAKLAAAGRADGRIAVFRVDDGETQLLGDTGDAIVSLAFCRGKLLALSSAHVLSEWDLSSNALVRSQDLSQEAAAAPGDASLLAVSKDESLLAVCGTGVMLLNTKDWHLQHRFVGHSTKVQVAAFGASNLLVTGALDERSLSVWLPGQTDAVGTLELDSPAVAVSCSQDKVGAVTQSSTAVAYSTALKKSKKKAKKGKAKKKTVTKLTQSKLATVTFAVPSDASRGAVVNVAVLSGSMLLARRAGMGIKCETLPLEDAALAEVDVAVSSKKLKASQQEQGRQKRGAVQELSSAPLATTLGSLLEEEASPQEETLAARLQRLADLQRQEREKREADRPTAASLHALLVQALRSDDSVALETVLRPGVKSGVIVATVDRLEAMHVIPLLEQVARRLQVTPARAPALSMWLQSVLHRHLALLLQSEKARTILATLHATLERRTQQLPRLMRLQGRVNVALAQADAAVRNQELATELGNAQTARVEFADAEVEQDEKKAESEEESEEDEDEEEDAAAEEESSDSDSDSDSESSSDDEDAEE